MWVDHENFQCQRYAHYENTMVQHCPTTRRNCSKCWNKIIHFNKAGLPVPSPPNKTVKLRQSEKGAFKLGVHSLPVNICGQNGCSLTSFKHKLDKYLQNIPDKPKIPGYTTEMDTNSITSMKSSRESWAIQLRLGWRGYILELTILVIHCIWSIW